MLVIAEIGSAFLTIAPSMKGFDTKLNASAGGTLRSSGKTMGGVFAKAFVAAGALIAAAGIGSFLKGAVEEAREAQKVGAATTAILKATGGAAKISAGQIGDLASSLSAKTAVDDEQIQAGENLLLTFKNVKREGAGLNDVFGRATAAGLDLAAAGFGSIEGNAKQLGKALNDPTKGIAALGKAGVTFTEAQKTQIAGFVKSNDLLSAQKIILGEVEAQVGGTAAATATSGEKAAVAFGNIKEQVGTALLPAIDGLFNLFLTQVPRITTLIGSIGPVFARVAGFVKPLTAALTNLIKNNLQPFFAILAGAGGAAVAGLIAVIGGGLVAAIGALVGVLASPLFLIGALVGVLALAYQKFSGFRAVVDQVVAAVKANFVPVMQSVVTAFTGTILPAVTSFVTYVASALLPIFRQVAGIITGQVIPIVASLATFLYGKLYPAVVQIATAIASKLRPIFDQLVSTFRSDVLPTVQQLLVKFREVQPTLQKIVLAAARVFGKFLQLQAAIAGKVIPIIIRLAGFLLRNLVPVIANVVVALVKVIGKIVDFGGAVVNAVKDVAKFVSGVKEKFNSVVSFVKGIPGKIVAALGNVGSLLKSAGGKIIQGLIDGVTAKIGALKSKLASITKLIPKVKGPPAKDKKLLTPAGRMIMDGLINGIESRRPLLATTLRGVTKDVGDDAAKGLEAAQKRARAAAKKLVEGVRDGLREKVDGLKSDFASLADSVSSAFTSNLFESTNAAGFISGLLGTQGQLKSLKAAFKTLLGYGLQPGFLSQLFASGNAGLILDLAAGGADQAKTAGALFGDVQSLSSQLGSNVATADIGPKLDAQTALLEKLVSLQGKAAVEFAKEINGSASKGARNKKNKNTSGKGK